mmetsp:Transcript_2080/g.3986  ORF Transcript_2080/g.3986 Transcript_2080/m.3986 type:complete len:346 (-) Transcript_2080:1422-2459(-)
MPMWSRPQVKPVLANWEGLQGQWGHAFSEKREEVKVSDWNTKRNLRNSPYSPRPRGPVPTHIRVREFRMIYAAKNGQLPVVQKMLEEGARVEATGIHGSTALMWAAGIGYFEMVQFLVEEAKADVEAKNMRVQHGYTVLMNAAAHGHLDIVKYLIEHAKANVHATGRNKATSLVNAACFGHLEVVRYLVEKAKANIGSKDKEGKTALIWGAYNGRYEVVDYLLEHAKASAEAKDENGMTATDHARKREMWSIVDLFENKKRVQGAAKALRRDLGFLTKLHSNILKLLPIQSCLEPTEARCMPPPPHPVAFASVAPNPAPVNCWAMVPTSSSQSSSRDAVADWAVC